LECEVSNGSVTELKQGKQSFASGFIYPPDLHLRRSSCIVSLPYLKTEQASAMKFNKIITLIIFGVVLLASLPFALGLIWPRINDVKTGETPQYPDVQPQRFAPPLDASRVFDAAVETSRAMGWEIREIDKDQGVIEAIATTRLLKFKDDVTITITSDGAGVVVNVRSKSRIGKGDLGTNARRIRAFQAELAKRF
jgi:uncharacterized protein (DUF1499 family)